MGNVELLKKTKEQILLFPETHNQKTWHCETSMCVAGHASVLAGAKLVFDKSYGTEAYTYLVDPEGDEVWASQYGMKVLDMTKKEKEYVFYCFNNEIAIKRMDHLIQLWEEGKVLDDVSVDQHVPWDGEGDNEESYVD